MQRSDGSSALERDARLEGYPEDGETMNAELQQSRKADGSSGKQAGDGLMNRLVKGS
jgi:hypothetical protein